MSKRDYNRNLIKEVKAEQYTKQELLKAFISEMADINTRSRDAKTLAESIKISFDVIAVARTLRDGMSELKELK